MPMLLAKAYRSSGGTAKRLFLQGAMMADIPEVSNGKARRRSAAKAAIRQSASKVKATIHISTEASQRLTVHAAMMGMDRSALVEQLINEHLRRYVVSDRGGAETATDGGAAA